MSEESDAYRDMTPERERRPWRSGPKPRPADEIRSERITMRLTPAEVAPIRAGAEAAGLSDSAYAYRLLVDRRPIIIPELNRDAWGELARLSANLNQTMRAVNVVLKAGHHPDLRQLPDQISEVSAQVAEVRRLLLAPVEGGDEHDDDEK